MKNIYLFLSVLVFQYQAQNLVPNPSFESYTLCPTYFGEVDDALGWLKSYQNNVNPHHCDYFNACNGSSYSTPTNIWGTETPATGHAYMVMTTKAPSIITDYRENIYAKLNSPLIVGQQYNVSLKVSLADEFAFASNNIGIKFSTNTGFLINNISHVYAASPISNQTGWTTISGIFVADSAYKYIGVGNYFDDAHTTEITACVSCPQAYNIYYIDDISVTLKPNTDITAIAESEIEQVKTFPNPTVDKVVLTGLTNNTDKISLLSLMGEKLFTHNAESLKQIEIDLSTYPKGIYFLEVYYTDHKKVTQKLIKE